LKTGRLIVKLNAARVTALIDEGVASPFAPAGKVFKEWAAVDDDVRWRDLLTEAIQKAER